MIKVEQSAGTKPKKSSIPFDESIIRGRIWFTLGKIGMFVSVWRDLECVCVCARNACEMRRHVWQTTDLVLSSSVEEARLR